MQKSFAEVTCLHNLQERINFMTNDMPDFQKIMRKAGAFRESMILFTAVELDLFSSLEEESKNAAKLAGCLGADSRALEILLDALVPMGFLVKNGDDYTNTKESRTYLARQSKCYRGAILRHLHHFWSLWGDLTETVRKGGVGAANAFLYSDPQKNRDYIWGMDNVGHDRADDICGIMDFSDRRRMLDLGCGAATYSIAFLKKNPPLRTTLFDLSITLCVARENVERNGLEERVVYRGGDYFQDDFGSEYDMVWISQVLHCNSESECQDLIEKSYTALAPGGWILIHDFLLNEQRTAPYPAALFSVHMLTATEGGRSYSVGEISRWFEEAGFVDIRVIEVGEQSSLVLGVKPD